MITWERRSGVQKPKQPLPSAVSMNAASLGFKNNAPVVFGAKT